MPALTPDHRRALKILADSAAGCVQDLMLSHGFSPTFIKALIKARLASAEPEWKLAAGHQVAVIRLRITDAGRVALGGC